jgi:hypothetical protein
MRRTRRATLVLAIATALLVLGAGSASAQGLSNPGEFAVDIAMPGQKDGGAMEPKCTPALDQTLFLTGGTAKCTMSQKAKAETVQGTAANPTLVASTGDAGFGSGTMTRTCDFDMQAAMDVTFVAGGGQPRMKMNGTVTMLCSWTMSFTDAQQSTLVGTMELNGKMAQNDLGNQSAQGADIEMSMKVYVTEGTGVFAGYVGSGELDQQQAMSLLGGNTGNSGSTGGGLTAEQVAAICAAVPSMPGSPSQCNATTAPQICTNAQIRGQIAALDQACTAAGRSSRGVRQATGDPMTLKLRKAAGQVRIVAPLPKVGAKGGKAKVTATTKVALVATKGAACTVRTDKGVLGARTSTDSAKRTTVAPKRGAWKGATWVQATCTLGGKSFSSTKVKVSM